MLESVKLVTTVGERGSPWKGPPWIPFMVFALFEGKLKERFDVDAELGVRLGVESSI